MRPLVKEDCHGKGEPGWASASPPSIAVAAGAGAGLAGGETTLMASVETTLMASSTELAAVVLAAGPSPCLDFAFAAKEVRKLLTAASLLTALPPPAWARFDLPPA